LQLLEFDKQVALEALCQGQAVIPFWCDAVSAGMQQAIATGELIDVPFIFSSNGDAFMMCDRTIT
jgi:hypothetical protein